MRALELPLGSLARVVFWTALSLASGSCGAEQHLTIDAKWLGACRAGESGGDVTAGGKTTNVFATPTR